jgi:hypothetical protein
MQIAASTVRIVYSIVQFMTSNAPRAKLLINWSLCLCRAVTTRPKLWRSKRINGLDVVVMKSQKVVTAQLPPQQQKPSKLGKKQEKN